METSRPLRFGEMKFFERNNGLSNFSQDYDFTTALGKHPGQWEGWLEKQIALAMTPEEEARDVVHGQISSFNDAIVRASKLADIPRQRSDLNSEITLFTGLFACQRQDDIASSLQRAAVLQGSKQQVREQYDVDSILTEHMELLRGELKTRNRGVFEPLHPLLRLSPRSMILLQKQANTPLSAPGPAPKLAVHPPKPPR